MFEVPGRTNPRTGLRIEISPLIENPIMKEGNKELANRDENWEAVLRICVGKEKIIGKKLKIFSAFYLSINIGCYLEIPRKLVSIKMINYKKYRILYTKKEKMKRNSQKIYRGLT